MAKVTFEGRKTPSQKKRYTDRHHKLAFETWYETGSWTRAQEALGGNPALGTTIRRWAKLDFRCRYGCPYHGWENLKAEKQKAIDTHVGPLVAVQNEKANNAIAAVNPPPPPLRAGAVDSIIRSDLERLAHLEILYAKAFYHATGISISCPALVDADGNVKSTTDIQDHFTAKGTKPQSFEQSCKTVLSLVDRIALFAAESGLRRRHSSDRQASKELGVTPPDETKRLDIESLRQMKGILNQLEAASPDERAALIQTMRSEQTIIDAQLTDGGPGEVDRAGNGRDKPADSGSLPAA